MFKTIKAKLTIIILMILLVVFGIQLASNYLFAETYYVNRKSKIMQEAYDNIRSAAIQNNDSIVDIMGNYEDYNNLQFVIDNKDLECIYNSKQYSFDDDKNKYKIKANFDFKAKIHLFTQDAKPILKEKKNSRDILILYGIIERGDDDFYILIRTPLQAIKEDMYETNIFILYVSGFALVLGAMFVYFFAKKTAAPIEEIDRIALNVTNLDFSGRASESTSNDEVGRLARNINRMADKLEDTIIDLKTANDELEKDVEYKTKIDEKRKEFVANVSHELKTPLAVLNGYAEILNNNMTGIDKEYYHNVILDEVQNMTKLVTTLLELSSMENGLNNMELVDTNITELVSHVLYSNDILFTDRNLDYSLDADEHFYVLANKVYLERAITNYITNAIKYSEQDHVILVTIRRIKKNIVVTVFNEGNHILPNEMNQIWDRFYRADKARTRDDSKSIGMGLYFVSAIMNGHHGKYGVRNVDKGVEFWLSLEEI